MTCPSCASAIMDGIRWCSICRTNTMNPEIGKLATPGKRLAAYVLDVIIPGAVIFILILAAVITPSELEIGIVGILLMASLWCAYAIVSLILFASGTTPGKKMLGMQVINEDGSNAGFFTMLIREWIGKVFSSMFLMLGYLWILIDKDNQGWHDKLMSTYVVD